MIELINVTKTFRTEHDSVEAVSDVSLEIEKGDIYGIIGLSGAGKSTLVRCINFLEVPTSGQVKFKGVDLASLSKKELLKTRRSIAKMCIRDRTRACVFSLFSLPSFTQITLAYV